LPEIIKHNSEYVYRLSSGRWASIPFYNEIMTHVTRRLGNFEDKGLFTLRDVCDKEYWASLSIHMRRIAGMCFRTMIDEKRFPLIPRSYKRSPTRYYEFSK